jgi:hypothetical protein
LLDDGPLTSFQLGRTALGRSDVWSFCFFGGRGESKYEWIPLQVFDNFFIQLIIFFGLDKKTRIKLSLKRSTCTGLALVEAAGLGSGRQVPKNHISIKKKLRSPSLRTTTAACVQRNENT